MKLLIFLTFISSMTANAVDSYRLTPGSSQYVHAYGLCAEVTNNFSSDLFISIKTEQEWKTVLSAASPSIAVTRSGCSCKSLLAMGNILSGVYTADPDGAGPLASYQVYCDMDFDGGGWTLAARSVNIVTPVPFGWMSSTGSVNDDTQPYSLGIIPTAVDVNEMLFGDYSTGKTWGLYVYKKGVPLDFFTTYLNASINTGSPTPLRGGITNFGMAAFVGYTYHTDVYYFRDIFEDTGYGLTMNGWSTAYATDYGGQLLGTQGLLMFR